MLVVARQTLIIAAGSDFDGKALLAESVELKSPEQSAEKQCARRKQGADFIRAPVFRRQVSTT
jgi:hypothetical protein